MNRNTILHHRPGESPLTAEYWVAKIDGIPEIVRVRQLMNGAGDMEHVVERFGEEHRILKSEWVNEHVQFIGSLALG